MISLNNKQSEAVSKTEGPLLILAGAGAGKTKTITERVVEIIRRGTEPKNVLAVTFTNKAAKEMRERIIHRLREEKMIDPSYSLRTGEGDNPFSQGPTIKTFHSLGLMIISEQANMLGLTKQPTILDTSDTLSIIKQSMDQLGIDPKTHDPSKIRHIISREKGDFNNVQDYSKKVVSAQMEIVEKVWKCYEAELKKQKGLDFDDLIVRAVRLLEENENVRNYYQQRFKYIHIDEYQDTNGAQYAFVKNLVNRKTNNICVVGDTDQNIYSWRGANLKNIMGFEKDFENTKIVLLEENYRSTGNILSLANTTIKKNTVRKDKNLFTTKGEGELIEILPAWDEYSEAEQTAIKIKELLDNNVSAEEIAVLYRANFQSRVLEEAMLNARVPYNVLGVRFFERKEVKDVMSYLRASQNRNSLNDLKRVFDTPKKGIGKVTVAKIFSGDTNIPKSAELKVLSVYNFLDKIEETLKSEALSHTLHMIIVDSGLEKELLEGSSEDRERLENIRELVSLTIKYDHLKGEEALPNFLEETSLQSDQDNDNKDKPGVRLMTVHASKGLEFDYVFIVGLEQDLFPHKNIGNRNRSKEEEEEERRLFYVAVTRARKILYLSYAELRTIFGQKQINVPSEFLDDVDENISVRNDIYYKQGGGKVVYI